MRGVVGWLAMNNMNNATVTHELREYSYDTTELKRNMDQIFVDSSQKAWGKDQDDPTTRQYAVLSRLGSEISVECLSVGHSMELPKTELSSEKRALVVWIIQP